MGLFFLSSASGTASQDNVRQGMVDEICTYGKHKSSAWPFHQRYA